MELAQRVIKKRHLLLLAIVLIGLFLRVYHLGIENLDPDEAFAVAICKLSLPQIVQAQAAIDVHPPLHFFILHYWTILFGDSEFAVRLLSVIFGVLAIPMIYVMGRLLFDEEVGLLGALILALSIFNIVYSREARSYSLMVLLSLLSMYFFVRFLRNSNLVILAGYVFVTTLLLYTHVYGLFVLLAQNLYLMALLTLSRGTIVRLRQWIVLQAVVVALFIPWVGVFIGQVAAVEGVGGFAVPTLGTFVNTFSQYAGTVWLSIVFFGLSVLSIFKYRKITGWMDWKAPLDALGKYSWELHITNVGSVAFLAVWLLTLNAVPFVISYFSAPIYAARGTIAASAAFYLLVAGGIRNINWRYVKLAVIAAVIILAAAPLLTYYTTPSKPQGREAIDFIDENAKDGDVVILFPRYTAYSFDYYNNRTDVVAKLLPSASGIYWGRGGDTNKKDIEDFINELHSDVNGYGRVWVIRALGFEQPEFVSQMGNTMNESYETRYFMSYRGYDVLLYEARNFTERSP